MVMETPTPQCVGREFVRQYYTLLNKAPIYLHRFYSQESSFLHGGIERPGQERKPVIGQHDIHQKIMELNFKDCHAKIRQVDSHGTLGDGVVVQVTGELSNNGQPMRRFMQTFVLGPQSPKKYYVRNDIFHYQDEIFTDDDEAETDHGLVDQDIEEEDNPKQVLNVLEDTESVAYYEPEIVRNGAVHASEAVGKFVSSLPVEVGDSPQPNLESESPKPDWEDEEEVDEDEEELEVELEEANITIERTNQISLTPEVESLPAAVSQEPKTYANMVSKNTPVSNAVNVPTSIPATSPITSQMPVVKSEPVPAFHKQDGVVIVGSVPSTPQLGSSFGQQPGRPSRPRMNSGRGGNRFEGGRDSTARSPDEFDPDKRKPASFHQYPDSQQLFVGNLTHSITEEDLKSHFTQYGTVLDMRINSKQHMKASGGKVPNFGFIVFEDSESVQKVLENKPIYFNSHRLNVEEKKRPKDNRVPPGDSRVIPGRGMPLGRGINMGGSRVGGGGGRGGGMLGGGGAPQGTGRGGENRGGMKGGSYITPRR